MSDLRPADDAARPDLLQRLDRLLGGPALGPIVLGLAGALFVTYRAIDRIQASIKADGWLFGPVADPAVVGGDLARYYAANLIALLLYLALGIVACRATIGGHLRSALLALAVGLHVGVVLAAPSLSVDALSYVAHGAIPLVAPGENAYSVPPSAIIGSQFGYQLADFGWAAPPMASPYGPLWTLIETFVARSIPTVGIGIVAMKLIAAAAALGSAALVWRIAGLVRPRLQLAATLLWLWNPVVVVELAGEGHNDGLMAFFALLSLYLTLRSAVGGAVLAAAGGFLVKYISAVLVPAQAVFLWRTSDDRRALVLRALGGAAGGIALTIGLFAPVWRGLDTFAGIEAASKPMAYGTLPGSLYRVLTAILPGPEAAQLSVIVPAALFLAFLAFQSTRVRDGRTLLESAAWIAVAYLLLARGLYLPWYAMLAIAMLVLTPHLRFAALLVVLTVVARMVAPLIDLQPTVYPFRNAGYTLTNLGSFLTLGAFLYLWATTPSGALDRAPGEEGATDDGAPGDGSAAIGGDRTTGVPTGAPAPALPAWPVEAFRRFRAAALDDGRPRSRLELLVLGALVAVPMIATGIALLPEILVRVPSLNDDMLHWLFVQNANDALDRGGNLLDHWLPQIETGFPQFLYYQHLAPLIVVALGRLSGGLIDLFDWFNIVRWVLMTGFPLTVLWSMRRMGFSPVAAAVAAAVAPLLAGNGLYGFEYDSYLWRGWGLFTQLLAMHLSFIALATGYRAISTGKGIATAAIAFGLLVLAHLIYAYMIGISLLVILVVGIARGNAAHRLLRLGTLGLVGAAISAYMWLPFLTSTHYLNATPNLQSWKYDSFGFGTVASWLVSGKLFDDGRAPVLTGLFFLGVLAALAGRRRGALFAVALAALWVVLYSGRPTLGPLADLLPMSGGLLFHRFIGAVDLAAIVLMGIGGAAAWSLVSAGGSRQGLVLAGMLGVLVLLPTVRERLDYYAQNTRLMERSAAAVAADEDARTILAKLETLPPGRVFAGLPTTWGRELMLGDVPFYTLFPYHAITALPPASESMSLTSDLIWDFDDRSRSSYEVFNVRYVVAPTTKPMADFLTPLLTAGRYTLYESPGGGYGVYARVADWAPVASQPGLLARNRAWATSTMPADRIYAAYDFPSRALTASSGIIPGCSDGGTVASESVEPDRFAFTTSCSIESAFVIKTTFHPNWRVLVDGAPVKTFMASPSYLGLYLPAGEHTIVARYEAGPLKTPLALFGLAALLLALVLRRRVDDLPEGILRGGRRLAGLTGRLRELLEEQLERERAGAERAGREAAGEPVARSSATRAEPS